MTHTDPLIDYMARNGKPFAESLAALPALFKSADSPRRLQVNVATTGPEPGTWLISIRENSCYVMAGSSARPDAQLYTDSDIGHAIISGTLSLADALRSRLLALEGHHTALEQLRASFDLGESQ